MHQHELEISFQGEIACLTPEEKEMLTLVASGYSNKMIANQLRINDHTLRTHICDIYQKINVNNRFQAVLWAMNYL